MWILYIEFILCFEDWIANISNNIFNEYLTLNVKSLIKLPLNHIDNSLLHENLQHGSAAITQLIVWAGLQLKKNHEQSKTICDSNENVLEPLNLHSNILLKNDFGLRKEMRHYDKPNIKSIITFLLAFLSKRI